MKEYICLILLFTLTYASCNNPNKNYNSSSDSELNSINPINESIDKIDSVFYWSGNLNSNIPILLYYKIDSNLIVGEIIYLNTINKLPITIIGTIENNNSYRILEFEKTGNISGIITGNPFENKFNGIWFSPKSHKELTMNLNRIDTIINFDTSQVEIQNIFGQYAYKYSEDGAEGYLKIKKTTNNKAVFGISSVTSEPARNIAQIEDDTITLNTRSFVYNIPDSDNCEFQVMFYRKFAYVKYTKGFCEGQFGNNASIHGIYFKID